MSNQTEPRSQQLTNGAPVRSAVRALLVSLVIALIGDLIGAFASTYLAHRYKIEEFKLDTLRHVAAHRFTITGGLLAAQRIRTGLGQAVAGAQQMAAATNSADAKISLLEVQQSLLTVNNQVITVRQQLNQLINLPACTDLKLDDPPTPQNPFGCADDAVDAAVTSSPKIREARLQVGKAEAAVRLAAADYYPSVNAYGLYVKCHSYNSGRFYRYRDVGDVYVGVGQEERYPATMESDGSSRTEEPAKGISRFAP